MKNLDNVNNGFQNQNVHTKDFPASLIFVTLVEPPSPAMTTTTTERPRALMGLFMDSTNGSIIHSSLAKPLIIQ